MTTETWGGGDDARSFMSAGQTAYHGQPPKSWEPWSRGSVADVEDVVEDAARGHVQAGAGAGDDQRPLVARGGEGDLVVGAVQRGERGGAVDRLQPHRDLPAGHRDH